MAVDFTAEDEEVLEEEGRVNLIPLRELL